MAPILRRQLLRSPKNFVAQVLPRSRPVRLSTQRWWEGFRDPTLNKLIEIAYSQNLTLLSAGTRVLQARAVLGIAIGISYPQVQQGTGSIINNKSSAAWRPSGAAAVKDRGIAPAAPSFECLPSC